MKTPEFVSRHPWRREFEKRYGSEQDLLAQTLRLLSGSDTEEAK